MNTKPRTILLLIGIFFAGAASGALLMLRVSGRPAEWRPFVERNLERMDQALGLTPEQKPQIEVILNKTNDELGNLRRTGAELMGIMNTQIEALLTAEQKKKFGVFQEEQAERLRRRAAGREKRGRLAHEGPPPGDAPPPPPR